MRFRLAALIKPVDPVVAKHPSSRDADAAVALLRRAGYGGRMLSVVGHAGASVDLDSLGPGLSRATPHWAASGTALGLLWALFMVAAVVLPPAGGAAFVALLMIGALTLALQAAVIAHILAPGRALPRERAGAPQVSATSDARSWHFLVLVHGSRSEVALARDILAAH